MNQDLIIRLFRSLEIDQQDDAYKVASLIIEEERKKGHVKLAQKLSTIIEKTIVDNRTFKGELVKILPKGVTIPTDKRYNFPLATKIEREELRHEMVLLPEVEEKIKRIEQEYAAKERLAAFGLKYRQKVLFYGHPGCGKSMSAERIAYNLGLPFLKVRFDVIISSYLGETASNLKRLFDGLKDYPCVLLLDEFDMIGKTRTSNQDVGEMHRIVNILLTLLEEYNSNGVLIATTNLEGALDEALFRRFDDIIELPKPSLAEIERLIIQGISAIKHIKTLDFSSLAQKMLGLSSALVVKITNDAAKYLVIEGDSNLTQMHFEKAIIENSIYFK